MAKIIPIIRKVNRALQKAQREQERKAKRTRAEQVRQQKSRIRESNQIQKQMERADRERERQDKRIRKEQVQQEKAYQKQFIERGKLSLAARVSKREQLKNSMLKLKVNT